MELGRRILAQLTVGFKLVVYCCVSALILQNTIVDGQFILSLSVCVRV